MNNNNQQELQLVRVLSNASLPEDFINQSNIAQLVKDIVSQTESVASDRDGLERARRARKDGNFIGNWWHNRDDQVEEAQLDLQKSIGRLTEKTSQLLIINTAISKVLYDQQQLLLEQQRKLEEQADEIKSQNAQILDQQKELEKQQKKINAANQGLLEAKGLTAEQAQKLVGCVKMVTAAEQKMAAENLEFRNAVEQRLQENARTYLNKLDKGLAEANERGVLLAAELRNDLSDHSEQVNHKISQIASGVEQRTHAAQEAITQMELKLQQAKQSHENALKELSESIEFNSQSFLADLSAKENKIKNTQEQLSALQEQHIEERKKNRLALIAIAGVALISLGWQISMLF